jgi:hypothetical protein
VVKAFALPWETVAVPIDFDCATVLRGVLNSACRGGGRARQTGSANCVRKKVESGSISGSGDIGISIGEVVVMEVARARARAVGRRDGCFCGTF